MLISHRKKFIYLKTVKTASTSVESYFEPYCMKENEWIFSHSREEYISKEGIIGYRGLDSTGKKWYNHMPAREVEEKVSKEIWDSYFKFCVIRNPFDKLISAFFFFEKKKMKKDYLSVFRKKIWKLSGKTGKIQELERKVLIQNFRLWVKGSHALVDNDKYTIDDQVCVDYFIRFEDLRGGIQHVCEHLDMPFDFQKLPRLKVKSRHNGLSINEFYDKATEEIVRQLYEVEINKFGYSLPAV